MTSLKVEVLRGHHEELNTKMSRLAQFSLAYSYRIFWAQVWGDVIRYGRRKMMTDGNYNWGTTCREERWGYSVAHSKLLDTLQKDVSWCDKATLVCIDSTPSAYFGSASAWANIKPQSLILLKEQLITLAPMNVADMFLEYGRNSGTLPKKPPTNNVGKVESLTSLTCCKTAHMYHSNYRDSHLQDELGRRARLS